MQAQTALTLKEASLDQLPEVALMNQELIAYERGHCPFEEQEHRLDPEQLHDRLLRFGREGRKVVVLQDEAGSLLGYSLITVYTIPGLEQRRCEINQFYVRPATRGHGLGRHMLELIREQYCPSPTLLVLNVIDQNTLGKAFWQRQGFEPYYVHMYLKV